MVPKILQMILQIGDKRERIACSVKRLANRKNLSASRYTLYAQKGLTLIEVLLAVAILGIGIVGVLRAYAGSISALETGQYSIDAFNLMKQKIADVEQMVLEDDTMPLKGDSGADEDFLWEWKINSTNTEKLNELILIVSHKNNPRTFSLKTYVVEKQEEEL